MQDSQVPQGQYCTNLQFAASGRQRGAVCGRPRAIDRQPVAHGQPVDLELAEHHSHPVPLTSGMQKEVCDQQTAPRADENRGVPMKETLHQPRCPPGRLKAADSSWVRPALAFLLVLLAAGLGLLARTAIPGRPLPARRKMGAGQPGTTCPETRLPPRPDRSRRSWPIPISFLPIDHPLLGRQAPDFELADPEGKVWNLGELRDGRPVVLIFYYGYHCVTCVRQLFDVNRDLPLFREVGARVVAISADPPELTRQRFQQYGPFGFPVLSDPGNKVAQAYRVFKRAQDGKGGPPPPWDFCHRPGWHGSVGQCWRCAVPSQSGVALPTGQDGRPFAVGTA